MIPVEVPELSASFCFVTGEQWKGIPAMSFTDTSTNAAPTDDLASASLTFYRVEDGHVFLTLTSSAGITILSANNWTLTAPARLITEIPVGPFKWVFKTVDALSVAQSWFYGTSEVKPSLP